MPFNSFYICDAIAALCCFHLPGFAFLFSLMDPIPRELKIAFHVFGVIAALFGLTHLILTALATECVRFCFYYYLHVFFESRMCIEWIFCFREATHRNCFGFPLRCRVSLSFRWVSARAGSNLSFLNSKFSLNWLQYFSRSWFPFGWWMLSYDRDIGIWTWRKNLEFVTSLSAAVIASGISELWNFSPLLMLWNFIHDNLLPFPLPRYLVFMKSYHEEYASFIRKFLCYSFYRLFLRLNDLLYVTVSFI